MVEKEEEESEDWESLEERGVVHAGVRYSGISKWPQGMRILR